MIDTCTPANTVACMDTRATYPTYHVLHVLHATDSEGPGSSSDSNSLTGVGRGPACSSAPHQNNGFCRAANEAAEPYLCQSLAGVFAGTLFQILASNRIQLASHAKPCFSALISNQYKHRPDLSSLLICNGWDVIEGPSEAAMSMWDTSPTKEA